MSKWHEFRQALRLTTLNFLMCLLMNGFVALPIGIIPVSSALEACGLQVVQAGSNHSLKFALWHVAAENGRLLPFVRLHTLSQFWILVATLAGPAFALHSIAGQSQVFVYAGRAGICNGILYAVEFGFKVGGYIRYSSVVERCNDVATSIIWLACALRTMLIVFPKLRSSMTYLFAVSMSFPFAALLLVLSHHLFDHHFQTGSLLEKMFIAVVLPGLADCIFEHVSFVLLRNCTVITPSNTSVALCMSVPKAFCASIASRFILQTQRTDVALALEFLSLISEVRRMSILLSGRTRVQHSQRQVCLLWQRLRKCCSLHESSTSVVPEVDPDTFGNVVPGDARVGDLEDGEVARAETSGGELTELNQEQGGTCETGEEEVKGGIGALENREEANPDIAGDKQLETKQEQGPQGGRSEAKEEEATCKGRTLQCFLCLFCPGWSTKREQEIVDTMHVVATYSNYVEVATHISVALVHALITPAQNGEWSLRNMYVVVGIKCTFEFFSDLALCFLSRRSQASDQYEQDSLVVRSTSCILGFKEAIPVAGIVLAFVLHLQISRAVLLCPSRLSERAGDQLLLTPLVTFQPCD
eukprot:TRINITY_DN14750_c0_g1_i2.p1 TRINITY_DN14750_c0_g1~~TRINITY_DN14750_c0_g1_i2.p1  ORF type:complete len:611 (+),score=63.28 TRINITY_DN14750_c0_g1_i2:76-1833(+)